jgi:hypothetical protein
VITVFTEIALCDRYQRRSTIRRHANSRIEPPVYPVPSERFTESAMVVPKVVEATIVAQ